jgi:hypothetical protein
VIAVRADGYKPRVPSRLRLLASVIACMAFCAFGALLAYNGRDNAVVMVLSIVAVLIFAALATLGAFFLLRFEWLERRYAERQEEV